MAASKDSSFAEATAVTRLSSHTYSANFVDDWCVGTVPHGGYVTSTFMQVATTHFATTLSAQNQPHTILLHLDFVRRTKEGPVLFTVQDTKLGRQTSTIHISLSQEGTEEVAGYITHMNMDHESGVNLQTGWKLDPAPLPVDLQKLREDNDTNWVLQRDKPYVSFRKAVQKVAWYLPRGGQNPRSIADEWVKLNTGENWTNESLGYICDMWPSVVESLLHADNPYEEGSKTKRKAAFWYPTLVLNLDIKKPLPPSGVEWLFVRVYAKQIKNGRNDLEVIILDDSGDIVALSHHCGLALPASRNLKRSDSKI